MAPDLRQGDRTDGVTAPWTAPDSGSDVSLDLRLRVLLFAAAYLLCAFLGHLLTVKPELFVTFWLSNGLYMVVLLRHERRYWLFFVAAACFSNLAFDLTNDRPATLSLFFCLGNSLESLAGVLLLEHFIGRRRNPFLSLGDTMIFIAVCAVASPVLSASVGVAGLFLHNADLPPWKTWLLWWSGDGLGILLTVPLVFAWSPSFRRQDVVELRWSRFAGLMVFVALFGVVVFDSDFHGVFPIKYLLIPLTTWAALSYDHRGSSSANMLVAVIAAFLLSIGHSDVATGHLSAIEKVISLQLFLAVLTCSSLVVASLTVERGDAFRQIASVNRSLEERIRAEVERSREKDRLMLLQGRYAAMGEMINNISHQWRQPLNNLGLYVQGLQIAFDRKALTREVLVDRIERTMSLVEYMSQTIDDFRNFFRKDKISTTFAVKDAAERALMFVGPALTHNEVKVEMDIPADVTISGFWNEYIQVLINLISNAEDILIERKVAPAIISLRAWRQGASAVITVTDNGGGIPEEIEDRIFDPYFSTKSSGQGSGIGLYMSKTIIEKNLSGRLTATNVDGGAEFRIEVPSET